MEDSGFIVWLGVWGWGLGVWGLGFGVGGWGTCVRALNGLL